MQGKIIRGIAGFYYVSVAGFGTVECKAKGVLRKLGVKPLVGDDVRIEFLEEEARTGSITQVLPRENTLLRPAVANVDQAVILFALSYPAPNLNLLDRFLLWMQMQDVPTVICWNKRDEGQQEAIERLACQYENCGSRLCFISAKTGQGIEALRADLSGKTTVLAGPSGVGKSSVMNALFPKAKMEVGAISGKIKRGKHTTRHSELFALGQDTYVMDTPGFTSLSLPPIEKEALKNCYPEFADCQGECRFLSCVHMKEPGCAVKEGVEAGKIPQVRYENYKQFYEELAAGKKY